jgi:hypothetical protein
MEVSIQRHTPAVLAWERNPAPTEKETARTQEPVKHFGEENAPLPHPSV